MIIAKFGGTSVANAHRIKTIYKLIKADIERRPVVVVSAVGGVTDLLISLPDSKNKQQILSQIKRKHLGIVNSLFSGQRKEETLEYLEEKINEIENCKQARGENSKAWADRLVSFGEVISSYIIAAYFNERGTVAQQVISSKLIVTDDNFGRAEFLPIPTEKKIKRILLPLLKHKVVPIVTGFIGATRDGRITTLGRGGSDYSASILGFCLRADEIQIWTDVDGVFTSDPKLVKGVRLIHSVSFKEASELAAFGAKVLHPRTIRPAIKAGIPVRVLNTLKPKSRGTLIIKKSRYENALTAISYKRRVTLVNIYSTEMLFSKGFLANIFSLFSKYGMSIDLVSVSEVSVSLTLDNDEMLETVVDKLLKFSSVSVNRDMSMISLIGEGVVASSGTIKKMFDILDREKIPVRMISLGATDINISLVVKYDLLEKAVVKLHDKLLLPNFEKK